MSWSVSATGGKESVRSSVESQFDSQAKNYEGKEEGKDILSARERALAMLDELDLTAGLAEGQPPRLASVSAWGSRSSSYGAPTSSQMTINVSRVDPPDAK